MNAKDRIWVALDVPTLDEAGVLAKELSPFVGGFKVGLQLITGAGAPSVVSAIQRVGGRVFYDGKFDDIPNTVGAAAREAAKLGVAMFNVHASAGIEAMRAAVANSGNSGVIAVTVLTSLDEEECNHLFGGPSKVKVVEWARDAVLAGVDYILCSPLELDVLKKRKEFSSVNFITPGIRPAWAAAGDQKRITTPTDAIRDGADMLVIGRPITNPPEGMPRVEAAQRIAAEIEEALASGGTA